MRSVARHLCILGTISTFTFNTLATDDFDCQMNLMGVPVQDYVEAVRKIELTPKSLEQAENDLVRMYADLPWFVDPRVSTNSQIINTSPRLFHELHVGVSAAVRGLDELAKIQAARMLAIFREIGIFHITLEEITAAITGIAESPKIYPSFSMAEFLMQKAPSVEAIFLHLLNSYQLPVLGGPRQAEMVRAVLQYSLTRQGNRALEIGYGTPIVLLALRYFTSMKMIGVDLAPVDPGQQRLLKPADVELLSGNFPDSANVRAAISDQGPYTVIYALDVIKKNSAVLKTEASPSKYARYLYSLLDSGGTVIILNDYGDEPYFSARQAEDAGFTIVRWGRSRKIPPELKRFVPYNPENPRAGNMALYVLRKGAVRADYLQAAATIVPKKK